LVKNLSTSSLALKKSTSNAAFVKAVGLTAITKKILNVQFPSDLASHSLPLRS
jgi:hypothetical protein